MVKLKQFRRDHFSKIVKGCIVEDLFDILRISALQKRKLGHPLTYKPCKKQAAIIPFVMIQEGLVGQSAEQQWQAWERANLTKISPDWAPVITQIEALREQTPERTFQILTRFVDGQNTLRDLSIVFKQPIIPLAKSLLPYASRRLLNIVEIPDLTESANDGFHLELIQTQPQETALLADSPVAV